MQPAVEDTVGAMEDMTDRRVNGEETADSARYAERIVQDTEGIDIDICGGKRMGKLLADMLGKTRAKHHEAVGGLEGHRPSRERDGGCKLHCVDVMG